MNPQHKWYRLYINALVRNSLSWNTAKKKTEGSWTHGRNVVFFITQHNFIRMAVFWKLYIYCIERMGKVWG